MYAIKCQEIYSQMFLYLLRTENVLWFCVVSVYFFVLKQLGTETKNHTADFICDWAFFCTCAPQTCFGVSKCNPVCGGIMIMIQTSESVHLLPPPPIITLIHYPPHPPPPGLIVVDSNCTFSVVFSSAQLISGLPINSDEFDSTNGEGGGGG